MSEKNEEITVTVMVEVPRGSRNKYEYNKETGLPSAVKIDIKLPPDFPEKYKASVLHVAGLCKVKKSIANPPAFEITTS